MLEVSDNYGSISDSPTERINCGGIWGVFCCLEDFKSIIFINSFSYISSGSCGTLKGKSESNFTVKEFIPHLDLNDVAIMFSGIVLTWIGFGTVFEIKNGTERTVSPYLTGGTVR